MQKLKHNFSSHHYSVGPEVKRSPPCSILTSSYTPHLSSALVPSESVLLLTPKSPTLAPAVGMGFISGSRDAGRTRYLTTSTSCLGIYADDESHNCPFVILLLALSRGSKSFIISMITIVLYSTVPAPLPHMNAILLFCFFSSACSHSSPSENIKVTFIFENVFGLCFCYSVRFTVTAGQRICVSPCYEEFYFLQWSLCQE